MVGVVGRLQGQLSVGAETIATLTSKVAKYRDRSKLIQEELSRATKNQAALSAALAESNQKYNQLVDVSKQEACIAVRLLGAFSVCILLLLF